MKATTTPIGTDIYGASYLDGANQTTVAGINATGTTLAEAVAQAEQLFYFGVALTTQNCEKDLIFDNATAIQTKDHLYFEAMQSLKDIAKITTEVVEEDKTKAEKYTIAIAPEINNYVQDILEHDPKATNVILLNYHNSVSSTNGLSNTASFFASLLTM